MSDRMRPQLGRLVVIPFATIGVIAAVLVWEAEHVDSGLLGVGVGILVLTIAVVVARRVHKRIDELAEHYETLLAKADAESRRAEQANRVKDEFLATLSHELRTPLNSVLGWTRLLASDKLNPTQARYAVGAIERAGWAQSRIIEDLLDISRIVAGSLQIQPRAAVVEPIIREAVDSVRASAEVKRLELKLRCESIGPVLVDPDRLRQITLNLLSNAVKFTPQGGRIDVKCGGEGADLVLSVSDTGIGFNEEVARHLFERFRQGDSSTTRRYSGLGLGLGIVRHLTELHGGTVTASSEGEGKGARFVVRLPIRSVSLTTAEFDETAPPSKAAPVLQGVTVLVVDDDPNALEFVRAALEQYGAVVMTADSAREARRQMSSRLPDVLLSDLLMPDEDGLQLIRDIRRMDEQHGGSTPAAALTALGGDDERRRAIKAGYQMHVEKPVDPVELAVAVNRLARQRVTH